MSIEDITSSNLAQFTGTSQWYRYAPGFLLTDGAKFLNDNGMGWFIDLVVSWQTKAEVKQEPFQTWAITKNEDKSCDITATDGGRDDNNPKVIAKQHVDFTDMLLKRVKLYLIDDGENKVLMLTSEY